MKLFFMGLLMMAPLYFYSQDREKLETSATNKRPRSHSISKPRKKKFREAEDDRVVPGYEKGYRKIFAHYGKDINNKTCSFYTCGVCNTKNRPVYSSNIITHLHNPCFPKEGVNCIHCLNDKVPSATFNNLREIVVHNVEKHSNFQYWRCGACDVSVPIAKFYNHFTNAVYLTKRHEICNITFEEFEKLIQPLRNKISLPQNFEITPPIESKKVEPENFTPPLNQWHWFKPVYQPNGKNTKQEITMSDPIINHYPEIFSRTPILPGTNN